jgi:beta-N-acetylhexosaminidase
MELRHLTRAILAPLLILVSCTLSANPGFWDQRPDEELVEILLGEMRDDEILGQVFMLGYRGTRPDAEMLDWIGRRSLGGIKIFSRNVDTLSSLRRSIQDMQRQSLTSRFQIPLLVATDQEGGWVRHIKAETSTTPGNLALGASGLPRDAFMTGYYIGRELSSLGINMNFAPTIDIYSNPDAAVIGPRAFSSDPRSTTMLALAYFKGMSASGVVATAKHFPGHGQASKDSHGTLPVVQTTLEDLWDRELVPYRVLIQEGLPAVMSGHLAYPRILGDLTPASRSHYFATELLRDRLGFQGVLVTDDLEMNGAISGGLDTVEAGKRCLEAGSDLILISHTRRIQERAWSALLAAMREDPDFKQRVTESARRVLTLKLRTFKQATVPLPRPGQPGYPGRETVEPELPPGAAAAFFRQSALRSVTLIKRGILPYTPSPDEHVLLIGQFSTFLAAGAERYPGADSLYFPYAPFYSALPEQRARIKAAASGYDTLIFCLANYNSLEILKSLRPLGKAIIVVSALTPVYLRETGWVESSLAVYGTDYNSFAAGFAALRGDYVPEGELPIDLGDPLP